MADESLWKQGFDAYVKGLPKTAMPKRSDDLPRWKRSSWLNGWKWAQKTQPHPGVEALKPREGGTGLSLDWDLLKNIPTFDEFCEREEIHNPHPEFRAGYNALYNYLQPMNKG